MTEVKRGRGRPPIPADPDLVKICWSAYRSKRDQRYVLEEDEAEQIPTLRRELERAARAIGKSVRVSIEGNTLIYRVKDKRRRMVTDGQ